MPGYERKNSDSVVITSGRTLDHAAGVYDWLSPLMTFYQEGRLSEKAMELLELKGRAKVLDVGCGTGSLTIKIAKRLRAMTDDFLVVGLDAAPKMIAAAKRKAKTLTNIAFDVEAAERLPYEDGYFDAAISTFFFHHVDYELKKKSLREMRRVLKKGGRAVIVDVDTPANLFGALCAWCGYFIFRQEGIRENINGKLREAIDSSRFRSWQTISTHLGYITIFELEK